MFGVTGDLARKKLMPAIYDLANRGLLPPDSRSSASPAGTGRTRISPSWPIRRSRIRAHAVQRRGVEQLSEASGSSPARSPTTRRSTAGRDCRGTGRGAGPARTMRSTCRSRRPVPDRGGAAQAQRAVRPAKRWLAPGGDREAVRPRPGQRPRAERHPRRSSAGRGVPHRPLPRQGDGAEPPGASLRQRDVRADLEPQPRRPRPDHDGRGHRHRWPAGSTTDGAARDVVQNHLLQLSR